MKSNICYRFVNDDMTSRKDSKTKWELGKWNKVEGKINLCEFGLHASLTPYESLKNVYGNRWFIAEYRGKISKEDNKFCANEMRLIKEIPVKVLQYFAINCAKRVLSIYEKKYPNDKRPALAIQVAEDFLDGKIDKNVVADAAHAAYDAAHAAYAAYGAAYAAYAAVDAAHGAYAAVDAAHAAEIKWQKRELNKLIKEYVK